MINDDGTDWTDPGGVEFGRRSAAWVNSEAGLRMLGLWNPEALMACGIDFAMVGSGPGAPTMGLVAAGPPNRVTPEQLRAGRGRAGDITAQRKIARARREVAQLKARDAKIQRTRDYVAEFRHQQEAREMMRRRVHESVIVR